MLECKVSLDKENTGVHDSPICIEAKFSPQHNGLFHGLNKPKVCI